MALAKSIIFKSENFLFTPNGLNPMLFTRDFLVENKPFKTFFFLKGPSSILLPQATLKENQLPCHLTAQLLERADLERHPNTGHQPEELTESPPRAHAGTGIARENGVTRHQPAEHDAARGAAAQQLLYATRYARAIFLRARRCGRAFVLLAVLAANGPGSSRLRATRRQRGAVLRASVRPALTTVILSFPCTAAV